MAPYNRIAGTLLLAAVVFAFIGLPCPECISSLSNDPGGIPGQTSTPQEPRRAFDVTFPIEQLLSDDLRPLDIVGDIEVFISCFQPEVSNSSFQVRVTFNDETPQLASLLQTLSELASAKQSLLISSDEAGLSEQLPLEEHSPAEILVHYEESDVSLRLFDQWCNLGATGTPSPYPSAQASDPIFQAYSASFMPTPESEGLVDPSISVSGVWIYVHCFQVNRSENVFRLPVYLQSEDPQGMNLLSIVSEILLLPSSPITPEASPSPSETFSTMSSDPSVMLIKLSEHGIPISLFDPWCRIGPTPSPSFSPTFSLSPSPSPFETKSFTWTPSPTLTPIPTTSIAWSTTFPTPQGTQGFSTPTIFPTPNPSVTPVHPSPTLTPVATMGTPASTPSYSTPSVSPSPELTATSSPTESSSGIRYIMAFAADMADSTQRYVPEDIDNFCKTEAASAGFPVPETWRALLGTHRDLLLDADIYAVHFELDAQDRKVKAKNPIPENLLLSTPGLDIGRKPLQKVLTDKWGMKIPDDELRLRTSLTALPRDAREASGCIPGANGSFNDRIGSVGDIRSLSEWAIHSSAPIQCNDLVRPWIICIDEQKPKAKLYAAQQIAPDVHASTLAYYWNMEIEFQIRSGGSDFYAVPQGGSITLDVEPEVKKVIVKAIVELSGDETEDNLRMSRISFPYCSRTSHRKAQQIILSQGSLDFESLMGGGGKTPQGGSARHPGTNQPVQIAELICEFDPPRMGEAELAVSRITEIQDLIFVDGEPHWVSARGDFNREPKGMNLLGEMVPSSTLKVNSEIDQFTLEVRDVRQELQASGMTILPIEPYANNNNATCPPGHRAITKKELFPNLPKWSVLAFALHSRAFPPDTPAKKEKELYDLLLNWANNRKGYYFHDPAVLDPATGKPYSPARATNFLGWDGEPIDHNAAQLPCINIMDQGVYSFDTLEQMFADMISVTPKEHNVKTDTCRNEVDGLLYHLPEVGNTPLMQEALVRVLINISREFQETECDLDDLFFLSEGIVPLAPTNCIAFDDEFKSFDFSCDPVQDLLIALRTSKQLSPKMYLLARMKQWLLDTAIPSVYKDAPAADLQRIQGFADRLKTQLLNVSSPSLENVMIGREARLPFECSKDPTLPSFIRTYCWTSDALGFLPFVGAAQDIANLIGDLATGITMEGDEVTSREILIQSTAIAIGAIPIPGAGKAAKRAMRLKNSRAGLWEGMEEIATDADTYRAIGIRGLKTKTKEYLKDLFSRLTDLLKKSEIPTASKRVPHVSAGTEEVIRFERAVNDSVLGGFNTQGPRVVSKDTVDVAKLRDPNLAQGTILELEEKVGITVSRAASIPQIEGGELLYVPLGNMKTELGRRAIAAKKQGIQIYFNPGLKTFGGAFYSTLKCIVIPYVENFSLRMAKTAEEVWKITVKIHEFGHGYLGTFIAKGRRTILNAELYYLKGAYRLRFGMPEYREYMGADETFRSLIDLAGLLNSSKGYNLPLFERRKVIQNLVPTTLMRASDQLQQARLSLNDLAANLDGVNFRRMDKPMWDRSSEEAKLALVQGQVDRKEIIDNHFRDNGSTVLAIVDAPLRSHEAPGRVVSITPVAFHQGSHAMPKEEVIKAYEQLRKQGIEQFEQAERIILDEIAPHEGTEAAMKSMFITTGWGNSLKIVPNPFVSLNPKSIQETHAKLVGALKKITELLHPPAP